MVHQAAANEAQHTGNVEPYIPHTQGCPHNVPYIQGPAQGTYSHLTLASAIIHSMLIHSTQVGIVTT